MSEWQPIEMLPHRWSIDVWIRSLNNPDFGRRACDVALVDGIWFGENPPKENMENTCHTGCHYLPHQLITHK